MNSELKSIEIKENENTTVVIDYYNNLDKFEENLKILWVLYMDMLTTVIHPYYEIPTFSYNMFFVGDKQSSKEIDYLHFRLNKEFLDKFYINYTEDKSIRKVSLKECLLLANMSEYCDRSDVGTHYKLEFSNAALGINDYIIEPETLSISISINKK